MKRRLVFSCLCTLACLRAGAATPISQLVPTDLVSSIEIILYPSEEFGGGPITLFPAEYAHANKKEILAALGASQAKDRFEGSRAYLPEGRYSLKCGLENGETIDLEYNSDNWFVTNFKGIRYIYYNSELLALLRGMLLYYMMNNGMIRGI
jgi:hypothetical protein